MTKTNLLRELTTKLPVIELQKVQLSNVKVYFVDEKKRVPHIDL